MPPPGPDFIAKAEALVGLDDPKESLQECLQRLHSLALYVDWFTLDVRVKRTRRTVRLIPGHWWGEPRPTGPRQQSDVMVIGKMAGIEEVKAGRYFHGPSGEILQRALLERIGCPEEECAGWYMTNIMKFGHPAPQTGNAISKEWIKDCRPLLQMELYLVKPKYILCLGTEAGKELLGPAGSIKNSIGKVFDYPVRLPDGNEYVAKVMTCIHPAAVAREPDLQSQLDSSLRLFTRLVQGESVGNVETDIEHIVVQTEEDALKVIGRMLYETKDGAILAIDCEWHGEYPDASGAWLRTIQISHKPKFACCIVLREKGGAPALIRSDMVRVALNDLFSSTAIRRVRPVGHFHRSDLPWLIHYGLDLRKAFEAPSDPVNGWYLTKTEGGFDTGTAAHSVSETDDYKLEVQATRLTGCPRYDMELQEAKKAVCKAMNLKAKQLAGYGDIPDDVLYSYSNYDVDVTRRLYEVYNGTDQTPGLLDCDEYGNNSRMAFWISQRASAACLEMEQTGLVVDMKRAEALVDYYHATQVRMLDELAAITKWPAFNLNSPFDVRELLYGPKYRGQESRGSPNNAVLCNIKPVKCTNKKVRKTWDDIERANETDMYSPSTDRETLGILFHQVTDDIPNNIIHKLRDIKFVGQLLKTVLKPAKNDTLTEDGDHIFEDGLLSYVY